jgi:isocitrate/isopropylmalate dehydrogenase
VLLFRYAAEDNELADQLERAVDTALSTTPTRDIGGTATTAEFTDAVLSAGFR